MTTHSGTRERVEEYFADGRRKPWTLRVNEREVTIRLTIPQLRALVRALEAFQRVRKLASSLRPGGPDLFTHNLIRQALDDAESRIKGAERLHTRGRRGEFLR